LLAYREDPSFFAVSRALGLHHQTVQRCVERAVVEGPMAALDDRPRPGRDPQGSGGAKNGKRHVVPLVPEAVAILRSISRRARKGGTADHVFGGGDGGFSGWSKGKANLNHRIAEASPVADWRLHDLRRTMKTVMSDELRVASEISEAILNHAKQGLEEVYNRAEYIAQKRTALAMWADHLNSIIEGADRKVVPMRPKEVLA
jgi:integrase